MATTTPRSAPTEHDSIGENELLRVSTLAELQEQGLRRRRGRGIPLPCSGTTRARTPWTTAARTWVFRWRAASARTAF